MIALTFLCGFAIEAVAVFWVHFAERGRAWSAGAFSALQAAALLGLTACSTWPLRVAFVAGYALGSVVAVKVKAFLTQPAPDPLAGYAVLVGTRPRGVSIVNPKADLERLDIL